MSNLLDTINDVFVLSTSGIPYYATCFAGPICKMKPDHLLQSGFIVAMFSFAKEFGQKSIIHVEFEEGLMVFALRKVENSEILIVFFTTNEPSLKEIKELVNKASDKFVDTYREKITGARAINTAEFQDFSEILRNIDLINRKPMGDISGLISKFKKKHKSFIGRLFSS